MTDHKCEWAAPFRPYPAKTVEFIEDQILLRIWNHSPDFGWSFNARFLEPMPRDLALGFLRSMAKKRLVEYQKGLWSEDGCPAGAGYMITNVGHHRLVQKGLVKSDETKERSIL